jgi:hypothetical protein
LGNIRGANLAAHGLAHAATLELHPGDHHFDDWQCSVRSVTTDLGTESKLESMAVMTPAKLLPLQRLLERTKGRHSQVGSAGLLDMYMFPLAIYIMGHLHTLWNSLQPAVTGLPVWPAFEKKLYLVLSFCNDRGAMDRFIQLCLPRESLHYRTIMRARVRVHCDWRWEFLEDALKVALPRWLILLKYF